jgi:hypothetical protein
VTARGIVDRRLRAGAMTIGAVRLAAGVALGGAPLTFLRWERDPASGTSMPLLLRTVGIRDLALGIGTVRALRSGSPDDVQRWIRAGLLSDVLDVSAGLSSVRTTGLRGLSSALVAAPMVVLDLWVLATFRRTSLGSTPHAIDATPDLRRSQVVIATLRRVLAMVTASRGFVEAGR